MPDVLRTLTPPSPGRVQSALRAAGLHLLLGAVFAAALVLALYLLWFPPPYPDLVRAGRLPWLILLVDVVCGPLLTAIVYDRRKPRRELIADLSVVVLLQVAALGYGIYALSQARPVVVAFEVDRFEVVIAADVAGAKAVETPTELPSGSLTGPRFLCTRTALDGEERWNSIVQSLSGIPPARRPDWWRPYNECVTEVRKRMRPLSEGHRTARPDIRARIEEAVDRSGRSIETLYYVPLTRGTVVDQWSLLLDDDAVPVGHVHMSGF